MNKPRNPKRSIKALTLFFILFSVIAMDCKTREPVSMPPVRMQMSPDGKPFLIYGLGFLCFLAWGSIRRKRESATGHLQKRFLCCVKPMHLDIADDLWGQ